MVIRPVRRASAVVALLCAFAAPTILWAHHSTAEYDSTTTVESQGIVAKVLWQNPHVRLEIDTRSFDGNAELWYLEGQSPGDLDRAHIPRDIVKPGDAVKFAGNPSARRGRHMYVTNVLLPDQTEIVLRANAPPRWQPNHYLSYTQATIDPARAAADRGEGIFRVWVASAQKCGAEIGSVPQKASEQLTLCVDPDGNKSRCRFKKIWKFDDRFQKRGVIL